MDLIDRAALIASMGLENAVKWGNKDGYQQDHSYSTLMRYEIKDEIDAQPTIPAVPLDKLCEWLGALCDTPCMIAGRICGRNCQGYKPSDAECWKAVITKWMEGLDAAD